MATPKTECVNKRQALAYAMEAWQKEGALVGFDLVQSNTVHYNLGARYRFTAAHGWHVLLTENGNIVASYSTNRKPRIRGKSLVTKS